MVEVKRYLGVFICGFLALLLAGCSTCCSSVGTAGAGGSALSTPICVPCNLCDLQNLKSPTTCCSSSQCGLVRSQSLQDTALCLAAQAGLACRSKQINQMLCGNDNNLDRIFNFNLLLLAHNVLPPVLEQGDNLLDLDDNQTIRIADRMYQIVSQARFVTTPPNWREYLWLSYPDPEAPYAALLPQNPAERAVWTVAIAQGWQQGFNQANQIYAANLARLKRDFNGMILYRVLLQQGMVSPPYVARTELGVTGTCDDLRINDQVLRITALPCLQTNPKVWSPVIDP